MTIDWNKLGEDLKVEVLAGLDGLLEGAKADLEEYGKAIAQDLVRAAQANDAALLSEIGHQLEVLAEINRIRAVNAAWATVAKTVEMIGRVAMKALAAVAAV